MRRAPSVQLSLGAPAARASSGQSGQPTSALRKGKEGSSLLERRGRGNLARLEALDSASPSSVATPSLVVGISPVEVHVPEEQVVGPTQGMPSREAISYTFQRTLQGPMQMTHNPAQSANPLEPAPGGKSGMGPPVLTVQGLRLWP